MSEKDVSGTEPTLPVDPDQFSAKAQLDEKKHDGENKKPGPVIVGVGVFLAMLFGLTLWVRGSVHGAAERIAHPDQAAAEQKVAVADNSEVAYCTPAFKGVLHARFSIRAVSSEANRVAAANPPT